MFSPSFSQLVNHLSSFLACHNQEDSPRGDGLLKVLWNSAMRVSDYSKETDNGHRCGKRVADHHCKRSEKLLYADADINCPKQIRLSACMCLGTCACVVMYVYTSSLFLTFLPLIIWLIFLLLLLPFCRVFYSFFFIRFGLFNLLLVSYTHTLKWS